MAPEVILPCVRSVPGCPLFDEYNPTTTVRAPFDASTYALSAVREGASSLRRSRRDSREAGQMSNESCTADQPSSEV